MKAGSCTVCSHPQHIGIDQAYIAGATVRELANRFLRSKTTIHKHVTQHIPAAAQKAIEAADARDVQAGDCILGELRDLRDEAKRLQAKAEKKNDVRTAIAAIRELVRLVELKARILGELRDREISVTNVQIDGDTAARMAEMFLARRQPKAIAC
jgi:hypothetical protein